MANYSVPREEIDAYLESLLILQYNASDFIKHKLTKGELREDFIKQVLEKEYGHLTIVNGTLIQDRWQSSQADFIHLKTDARIGSFRTFEINDCKLFMEIKSDAKKSEFVALNSTAIDIKSRCKSIKVGMLCYTTNAKPHTVLKSFGFKFDKEIEGYNSYDESIDLYPNIDFMYSLNVSEDNLSPYFIMRDMWGKNNLYIKPPVINNFFNLFRGDD